VHTLPTVEWWRGRQSRPSDLLRQLTDNFSIDAGHNQGGRNGDLPLLEGGSVETAASVAHLEQ
jgi:hypothetical protein